MKTGFILWEGLTVAVIAFGAVAVFMLRRWLVATPTDTPPGFWLRFSALFCGLCIVGLIESVLMSSYGVGWFLVVMGVTLIVVAKNAPKLLIP